MSNVHIISDLYLEYNEPSSSDEVIPSNTDLVVFNGNIGKHIKRGFLYIEKLCHLYPDVQFVVNLGLRELYVSADKYINEISHALEIRRDTNPKWPKNLHYSNTSMIIPLRDGNTVDVLCKYGFPKIYNCKGLWEDTVWYKNHQIKVVYGHDEIAPYKPASTSNVLHGAVPIFASMKDINELHEKEWKTVQDWELTPTVTKILVTHINPYKDSRCDDCTVAPYNIHLEHGYWIGSNQYMNGINFLGSKLYANPGTGSEARSRFFVIK